MGDSIPGVDRRALFKAALGSASVALVASSAEAAMSAAYPPDVNRKFFADGRVHPFPGNTIICHLPQQGRQSGPFYSLLDIYRDAPNHQFIRKIALLPPSSYHMTVFGGANDRPRVAKSWPADLPLGIPLDQCTSVLQERLAAAKVGCRLPIRMKVDPQQRPVNGQALTMLLLPFDDSEIEKLHRLRREIAAATSLPISAPDDYRFHVTIGYSIAWLTASEDAEMRRVFAGWAARVAAQSPVFELGAPEFCSFGDMYAYHRLSFIDGGTATN